MFWQPFGDGALQAKRQSMIDEAHEILQDETAYALPYVPPRLSGHVTRYRSHPMAGHCLHSAPGERQLICGIQRLRA